MQAVLTTAADRLREQGRVYLGSEVIGSEVIREVRRPFSHLAWVRFRMEDGARVAVLKTPLGSANPSPEIRDKSNAQLDAQFRILCDLTQRFLPYPGFGVIRPIAFFADLPVLVTEAAPGESVHALVARKARWKPPAPSLAGLNRACSEAGRWLAVFQSLWPRGRRISLPSLFDYVALRVRLIAENDAAMDAALRKRVLDRFEGASRTASDADLEAIEVHGDFAPGNVLIAEGAAIVLDFNGLRVDSIFYDATRFLHQIRLFQYKPWYRPGTIGALRRAFLEGYSPGFDRPPEMFRLTMIQHLLCHWWGCVKPRPRPLASRLYDAWVRRQHRRDLLALLDGRDDIADGRRER